MHVTIDDVTLCEGPRIRIRKVKSHASTARELPD